MTNETLKLPLFSLPLVACPTEVVPLHIFEPRYRELMSWCLQEQDAGRSGEFVIAFAQDGEPAPVATVVRLTRVIKQYEDGRLDVVTLGRRRCLIKRVLTEHAYPTVEVEPWEDEQADWSEPLATEAFKLHSRLIHMVSGQAPDTTLYAGRAVLSFYMAPTSGLRLQERQALLKMTDENERLRYMIDHLRGLVERMAEVQALLQMVQEGLEIQRLAGAK